jgi:hypothetical protein
MEEVESSLLIFLHMHLKLKVVEKGGGSPRILLEMLYFCSICFALLVYLVESVYALGGHFSAVR